MKRQSVTGVLRLTRGRFRRLMLEDEAGRNYQVAPPEGLSAFPGDRVRAEVSVPSWGFRQRRRGGPPQMEARLTAVLARGKGTLLGRYRVSRQRAWVVPRENDILPPIEVDRRDDVPEGALVAVDIGRNPAIVGGRIAAVWTDPDAPASVIDQLIWDRDLPREFPDAVTREAARLPDRVPREEAERRRDLRGLEVVVIDPADARDHDDAVSWEPSGRGGRLGIHIADVSWYVRPGSALDEEARARGVSVYLTDRVLPMLPPRLSADLCSLMQGQDRLALSVFLDLDRDCNVVHGELVESVVNPTVSLSYEEAWKVMQDKRSVHRHAKTLHAMHEVSTKMREKRHSAGSLDFSFPETKVVLGSDGEPAAITQRLGDPSHWLVEEFMIAANTWTGIQLERAGRGIWRVHEPPEMDDVAELEEFLKGLGVKLRRGAASRDLHPKDFQAVLERFKGTREEYVVHRKVLQALRLAVYSADNKGHFGLALKTYTHFTSPIRRYADLLVHRMLRPGGHDGRYNVRALGELAQQTSDLERRAQEGEWACTKMMVLRYLKNHVGETFEGTVARIERYGAFVELDGIGQAGLLPMEELGNDRFQVARDGLSMRANRGGKTLRVGQRIKVIVARVDPGQGFLDLAIARQGRA